MGEGGYTDAYGIPVGKKRCYSTTTRIEARFLADLSATGAATKRYGRRYRATEEAGKSFPTNQSRISATLRALSTPSESSDRQGKLDG